MTKFDFENKSDQQIRETIGGMNPGTDCRVAGELELEKRKQQRENEQLKELKKPHWSLIPSFIVILLTMLFAAIAAWPVIREWIQPSPSVNINSNSQPLQSNSKIIKQGQQQK
jgi:hypothetical protein